MSEFSKDTVGRARGERATRWPDGVLPFAGFVAVVAMGSGGCSLVSSGHRGSERAPGASVAPAVSGTGRGTGPGGAQAGSAGTGIKPYGSGPGEQASAPTRTIKEIVDNGLGAPVFADNHGSAVTHGGARIPNETIVDVSCFEPNASGMTSVTEFYVIVGGQFDGDRSPSDVFRNGGPDGPNAFNTDPAVPPC